MGFFYEGHVILIAFSSLKKKIASHLNNYVRS